MRRSRVPALVVAVLAALVASGARGQNWETVRLSRQLDGERALDVQVKYGAGHFTVRPAERGTLYSMNLRLDRDHFQPVADYSARRLRLGTETIGRGINIGRHTEAGHLDLDLSTEVVMDLDLDFGAVKADIDLGGMRLTGLEVETGASETRLDVSEPNRERMARASFDVGAAEFTARRLGNLNADRIEVDAGVGDITLDLTGEWSHNGRLSVDMGLGALQLRIPRGLGIRLEKDTFLTSLDSEGLVKRGDAYYSLDYDEAEFHVSIDIDAAFGSVRVVWVR